MRAQADQTVTESYPEQLFEILAIQQRIIVAENELASLHEAFDRFSGPLIRDLIGPSWAEKGDEYWEPVYSELDRRQAQRAEA